MKITGYATTDPNMAAFLMARGHLLREIRGAEWRSFIFEAAAADDAPLFHQNAAIPARTFVRAQRDVRSLLHHS
jgi:hypothetical protein